MITLPVSVTDDSSNLKTLHVKINGVPVYGRAGQSITGQTFNQEIDVLLNRGMNRIEVNVENERGAISLTETFEIRYLPQSEIAQKPDLYFLSIGVSDYENEELTLDFAAKDALDLTALYLDEESFATILNGFADSNPSFLLNETYQKRLNKLADLQPESFGNIHVKTLLDREVTRESILEMRAFFERAGVDDQVMIFIAGHGFLDDDLNYYYAPADFDVDAPARRGIRFEELESLTDGIIARRRLMMMDTCHSGELDRSTEQGLSVDDHNTVENGRVLSRTITITNEPVVGLQNSFELMRNMFTDLRHSSGMVTMSAAAGVELAYETQSQKNGIFTYSLIDYLENEYQVAPLNTHLQAISEKVRSLSSDRQSPQFRSENRYIDVVIW